ncbi:uncharacterized protein N7477_004296 [Penicillium maclennaniae]|uniref:uncharacterized protein n=1 Tax=Penicillium maclennaniae TaxID=1343394 RepID=UPI0025408FA4|nr:uncharacterized protein N7477_004296 [Penicillium maclennaniae]KAJ5674362.1 hypothetical protein N7477_004296 [Penicillium maclennaniae]
MNVFNERRGQIALYASPISEEGITVALLLEYLRQPHSIHFVDSAEAIDDAVARKTSTSLPAIIDVTDTGFKNIVDGDLVTKYLLDRYDEDRELSYPDGSKKAREVDDWISFFKRTVNNSYTHATSSTSSGGTPVVRDVLRIYLHLEQQLQKTAGRYVTGNKLTIADLVAFPFTATAESFGLDLERFPEVAAWYNRLFSERPVSRVMAAFKLTS